MANETVGSMKDRVAIITGGSRGLGRNTAANLAGRGANVIFTYRANQKEADSLIREVEAKGRKAAGFRLDTGDIHTLDGFVEYVRKTLQGWGREDL
jgi:NAD(P)-dependent dehydrogenase (short-subunit alcohol dehydrogenase family)